MKNLCLLFTLLSACAQITDVCPEGYSLVPQKQTMVTPSGVVTQPNEYGQLPPGTLRVGENICIRKQGVIEPRPAFENFGTPMPVAFSGSAVVWGALKLWQIDDKTLVLLGAEGPGETAPYYEMKVVYADGTFSVIPTLTQTTAPTRFPGKIQVTTTRDRTIVVRNGTAPRVLSDDDLGSTGGGSISAPAAGLPMPAYVDATDMSTTGDVVSDGMFVSYRAVFRRRDGAYTFQGAVSAAYVTHNQSGHDSIPSITVKWPANYELVAGDEVELFRTEEQDEAELVGDRHRYAVTHVLDSSDISAREVTISDTAIDLGADLYFNSEQEGATQTHLPPPLSDDVVTFKDATFYVSRNTQQARTASIPYGLGPLVSTTQREHGIGSRIVTGDYTNGSPTILNVDPVEGLVVGQRIATSAPGVNSTILSIVGTTVTLVANATDTAVGSPLTVHDRIEIDGSTFDIDSISQLQNILAESSVSVVASPSVAIRQDIVVPQPLSIDFLKPIGAAFGIRATNGQNYSPALPEISSTAETSTSDPRTNRAHYSEPGQPEAVGPSSTLFAGKKTLLKLVATQESLFAFCTDGIFRIVGDGDDWSVVPFDPDTILLAPDAVDTMDNTIYALTTAGFVKITESGVEKISSPLIGNDIRALWKRFQDETPPLPFTWAVQVACDKYRNEVWINFNNTSDDASEYVATYVWNTDTNTFTTQSEEQSIAVAYIPSLQSIVVGSVDSNSDLQLRKYSDDTYMSATLEFNPVVGEDVGYLKQWIDATLLFEDLAGTINVTPSFEGVDYSAPYSLTAGNNFEHVCAVLQDYAYNKHCRFGIELDGDEHWSILGLTYRFRTVSETLRS